MSLQDFFDNLSDLEDEEDEEALEAKALLSAAVQEACGGYIKPSAGEDAEEWKAHWQDRLASAEGEVVSAAISNLLVTPFTSHIVSR